MNRPQRGNMQYPRVQQTRPNAQGNRLARFSTSLSTFQQVLGVIQSTAPYIEKYGPIVQKLPTMYRVYRAMKNIDDPVNEDGNNKEPTINLDKEPSIKPKNQIGSYPLPTLFI